MVHYAHSHYALRAVGTFGSGALDNWSAGLRLADPTAEVPDSTNYAAFLAAIAPAIETFHKTVEVRAGNSAWLKELHFARVGTDGKYNPTTQVTTIHTYATPFSGVGISVLPWNSACVTSLKTAFPRGIASNGRMYWPATSMPLNAATGRMQSVDMPAYALAVKAMIEAINTAAAAQLAAGVRVAVVGADGKSGSARSAKVTSIRIDDRLDTIERRENDQPVNTWTQGIA